MTYRQAAELPRPIVLLNGTFDLLHPSHIKRLAAAGLHRDQLRLTPLPGEGGGSVVVSLDTDRRVARLKGRPPVLSLWDRTAIIAPYPYVDAVVWHSDDVELWEVIQYLRPDVWVSRPLADSCEIQAANAAGCETVILDRQGPHSSTLLRDRLLAR